MEKISEQHIRFEKVNRLKTKILSEIDLYITNIKNNISEERSDEAFKWIINECCSLYELRRFINMEYRFMRIEYSDCNMDKVIYSIPDKTLNIWLQDDYAFVRHYLTKVDNNPFNMLYILDERYLGLHFTNIFDILAYERRSEENESEE